MSAALRIAFLHPELGLGGGERLMVDAALALQARGHRVRFHTAHHPAESFAATRDGRLDVRVHGRHVPLQLAGRLRLPLAVARMAALGPPALRGGEPVDAVVCDAVAQAVPLLRWLTSAPFIFYGHYPDALLTPPRRGWYRWYRLPLDRWEAAGLEAADRLLVNSAYTADAFRRCFPALRCRPEVLHPSVDLARFAPGRTPPSACHTVAVIGRLVEGKNVALAIDALATVRARLAPQTFAVLRLVIAGGYDARLRDCRDTVAALQAQAAALGLAGQVEIRRSPDDAELQALLARSRAVLYTPAQEHFGYVPLEAMAAGRPVVAVDAGGPTETVVDGATGFLRPPTAAAFADALHTLVADPAAADRLGAAGRARGEAQFSLDASGERLEAIAMEAARSRAASITTIKDQG